MGEVSQTSKQPLLWADGWRLRTASYVLHGINGQGRDDTRLITMSITALFCLVLVSIVSHSVCCLTKMDDA